MTMTRSELNRFNDYFDAFSFQFRKYFYRDYLATIKESEEKGVSPRFNYQLIDAEILFTATPHPGSLWNQKIKTSLQSMHRFFDGLIPSEAQETGQLTTAKEMMKKRSLILLAEVMLGLYEKELVKFKRKRNETLSQLEQLSRHSILVNRHRQAELSNQETLKKEMILLEETIKDLETSQVETQAKIKPLDETLPALIAKRNQEEVTQITDQIQELAFEAEAIHQKIQNTKKAIEKKQRRLEKAESEIQKANDHLKSLQPEKEKNERTLAFNKGCIASLLEKQETILERLTFFHASVQHYNQYVIAEQDEKKPTPRPALFDHPKKYATHYSRLAKMHRSLSEENFRDAYLNGQQEEKAYRIKAAYKHLKQAVSATKKMLVAQQKRPLYEKSRLGHWLSQFGCFRKYYEPTYEFEKSLNPNTWINPSRLIRTLLKIQDNMPAGEAIALENVQACSFELKMQKIYEKIYARTGNTQQLSKLYQQFDSRVIRNLVHSLDYASQHPKEFQVEPDELKQVIILIKLASHALALFLKKEVVEHRYEKETPHFSTSTIGARNYDALKQMAVIFPYASDRELIALTR